MDIASSAFDNARQPGESAACPLAYALQGTPSRAPAFVSRRCRHEPAASSLRSSHSSGRTIGRAQL